VSDFETHPIGTGKRIKELEDMFRDSLTIINGQDKDMKKQKELIKQMAEVINYPDTLPSDIYDLRDCFAEWCEKSRELQQSELFKEIV
jgi:hypothetical protein